MAAKQPHGNPSSFDEDEVYEDVEGGVEDVELGVVGLVVVDVVRVEGT